MTLNDILTAAQANETGLALAIPPTWMQGRTAYGGLTAAIALDAALRSEDDLPPLRSAQIAFVGPVAGEVTVETRLLRRGRTAAFIEASVYCDGKLGTRGLFVFMTNLKSGIDMVDTLPATSIALDEAIPVRPHPDPSFFTNNFEFRYAAPKQDEPAPEFLRWAKLGDRTGLHPAVELMAIGDAMPPAAMMLAKEFGPISSMTWMVNVLSDAPASADGWWLTRSVADYARNGSSNQTMQVWNSSGDLILSGMQSVAIFV